MLRILHSCDPNRSLDCGSRSKPVQYFKSLAIVTFSGGSFGAYFTELAATFLAIKRSLNQFVSVLAMGLGKIQSAMIGVGVKFYVPRICASSILANMVAFKAMWNLSSQQKIAKFVTVNTSARIFGVSGAVASLFVDVAYPIPASSDFIQLNSLGKVIDFSLRDCEHGEENPTQPQKVEPAERWRQSEAELVNDALSFSGGSNATSTVAQCSINVNQFRVS